MNKQQAKERIAKLKKEIEHHRYLYHVLDSQEISDAAQDSLKHELFELENKYPDLITPDSPSQRVGGQPLGKFTKVNHSRPILSLEDVFNLEEVTKWAGKNQKIVPGPYDYYCELKLDGLTVVLTYQDGILVKGATRGDGRTGEEVTQNLKTIESIPLNLNLDKWTGDKPFPKVFEVRGEIVMNKEVFNKINKQQQKKGLPLFANPRNVASGSIRQLDPKIAAQRKLDCFVFEIITDIGQTTHEQVHQYLNQLGFKTNPHNQYCPDLKAVGEYLDKWSEERQKLSYQTDGVVIVINDIDKERRLGSVGKAERWMVAYKFPAEQAATIVEDIQVQVGRIGTLTPVAILKPVLVAGTTVSRATLHNQDEINRLDVKIGDTVIIQKAGDIIPDVVKVLPNLRTGKEKKFVMPKNCPICGSAVVRPQAEVNYYCTNKQCFAVEKERLVHFVSKKAFNIEGLGPKIIELLISKGLVNNAADLFNLKTGDLQPLERFAEKSAANLVEAISGAKEIDFAKFIYALGIRHVGEETAVMLAENFSNLLALQKATLEQLEKLPDIGGVMAKSIYDYFSAEENKKLLADLLKAGIKIKSAIGGKHRKLEGKTFVLTGSLSSLTRDEAKEKIRLAGGHVSGSISSNTDYLVLGADPGSKLGKAKKLKVVIISEQELLKLL